MLRRNFFFSSFRKAMLLYQKAASNFHPPSSCLYTHHCSCHIQNSSASFRSLLSKIRLFENTTLFTFSPVINFISFHYVFDFQLLGISKIATFYGLKYQRWNEIWVDHFCIYMSRTNSSFTIRRYTKNQFMLDLI